MTSLTNSRSLTDFQRNARHYIEELNHNHEPLLVTVNGQVQAVMLDPQTFQAFENFVAHEKFIAALQEGLDDLDEGRVQSLADVKSELKAKYGV